MRGRKGAKGLSFDVEPRVANEIFGVAYAALAILVGMSIGGKLGVVGTIMQKFLLPIFGWGVYGLPVLFGIIALIFFFNKKPSFGLSRGFGVMLLIISVSTLIHLSVPSEDLYSVAEKGLFGGYIGFTGAFIGIAIFGLTGSYVVFSALLLISFLLTLNVAFSELVAIFSPDRKRRRVFHEESKEENFENVEKLEEINIIKPEIISRPIGEEPFAMLRPADPEEDLELKEETSEILETPEAKEDIPFIWEYPGLDLLKIGDSEITSDDAFLKRNAEVIRNKLSQFGIEVTMQDIHVGPTVVQYTLKPDEGVKLSKITSLKSDLALALAAKAIRIEAPIPGKGLVGIEIPNDRRANVFLRDIMESEEYGETHSKLRICLGRDVSGVPVIADLAKMPHLLIAGATGSGKSVGMNTFLVSLLYQNSPREMQFIMVDPKRVELSGYNGIPHLVTPVITDPEKAAIALRWAVSEMGRRYQILADMRHRNLKDFNADPKIEDKMACLVVVIDELADLMMAAGKEVEASICRLAQMGRAVGIHLMVATQRPSVDVITGLIKANIPARVAFTVSSSIDSRVILDCLGAEDLLGQGDMLYLAGDVGRPIRLQGVFVSSLEIERVTNYLKLSVGPKYNEDILSRKTAGLKISGLPNTKIAGDLDDDEIDDDLYEEALAVVSETGKASAALLQRRLRVGYARAARLLDILESKGIIGPVDGAKARKVFMGRE
ncbi:DNA translocase FtsK 4TM domain-containing protein [Candidatus Peregrinibacteria bacterium]|nr:DNA translocase FtsK 4TM domain-containing protein [Candidatus Peregrinibacteria bacterium]